MTEVFPTPRRAWTAGSCQKFQSPAPAVDSEAAAASEAAAVAVAAAAAAVAVVVAVERPGGLRRRSCWR
jgi:hypothetical protein